MSSLCIVVVAFNRPLSLARLLRSLSAAHYPLGQQVRLYISIDGDALPETVHIAQYFEWAHGDKYIEQHAQHLGLKTHLLHCGSLALLYGAVVVLEDDLLVSPFFYDYALQAIRFYDNDDRIAAISLYSYDFAENGHYPFCPLADGSDVYFMQVAISWGQVWTAQQWRAFDTWRVQNAPDWNADTPFALHLPKYVQQWSAQSWKKYFALYLLNTQRYVVYPRLSLSTNFADAGVHERGHNLHQVLLQTQAQSYHFLGVDDSKSLYDAFFEPCEPMVKQHCRALIPYDFDVDLYGTKETCFISKPFVLSSRPAKNALFRFGQKMFPPLLNVIYGIEGNDLCFAPTKDVDFSTLLPDYLRHYRYQQLALPLYADYLQLPQMSLIVLLQDTDNATDVGHFLANVAQQYYPNLEVVLVGQNAGKMPIAPSNPLSIRICECLSIPEEITNKETKVSNKNIFFSLENAFAHSTGDVVAFTSARTRYQAHTLLRVGKAFASYQEVHWLLGYSRSAEEVGNKVRYRLSATRFFSLSASSLGEILSTPCVFWRRYLGEETVNTLPKELPLSLTMLIWWAKFWAKYKPALFDMPFIEDNDGKDNTKPKDSFWSQIPDEKVWRKWAKKEYKQLPPNVKQGIFRQIAAKFAYPFFEKNIPYLRFFYPETTALPDVIRYDKNSDNLFKNKY